MAQRGTGFPLASTQGVISTEHRRPCIGPTAGLPPADAVPRPVAKPRFPALFAPNQFTPISRPALRATSRNRTLSITCCDGATVIAFTTLPSGTMVLATCTARSAATELPARPLSTIWPLLLPTRMPLLPVLDRIFCCRLPVSIDDIDIEDADLLHRIIEQDDVGGSGLLALDVDQVIA